VADPAPAALTSAALVPGDTVALLSPASWSERDWVDSSVAMVRASGLEVALGAHAADQLGYLAGVASLHGCVAGRYAEETLAQLLGAPPRPLRSETGGLTTGLTTRGVAEGRLFGGSLEMLARTIGVFELDLHGHVLLLEANRAAGLGMIDRALAQLRMSGSLNGITGLAVGRFDGYEGFADRGWTVLDVLHDHLDDLGLPILGGLPLGHGQDPRTVPLGVACRLDADRGTLTVAPALSPALAPARTSRSAEPEQQ